jgi:flagellar biosynthesis/type III secretory pathway M-ring protein FliF/YscJ
MREEVLEDLQEESQFILPLRTRLALVGLLAASLCVVIILVPRANRQPAQQQAAPPAPVAAAPEKQPDGLPVPPSTSTPKTSQTPDSVKASKPFSKEMADIEVLAALIREDVTLEPDKAAQLLAPYARSDDPAVKKAAQDALNPVNLRIDERSRAVDGAREETGWRFDRSHHPSA